MRHSEITLACEKGFYIDPSLVKPLGMHNKSYCYGVFAKKPDPENKGNEPKDLIISAFPYRSWGGIVRLQIRVKKDGIEESTIKIFKILCNQGLNILAMQTLMTGYTHHLLDIIVEVSEYRSQYDEKIICSDNEIKEALKEIYEIISKIMEDVKKEITTELIDKLYQPLFNYLEGIPNNKFYLEPVNWEWLYVLALHAFAPKGERLRFKYKTLDTEGLILFDKENSGFSNINEVFNKMNEGHKTGSPFLVLTSFNLLHHNIRLSTIPINENNFYTFKTRCKVKIHDEGKSLKVSTLGTRGLTGIILDKIHCNNSDFKFISASVEGLQREDSFNEKCLLYVNGLSSNKINNEQCTAIENGIKNEFTEQIKSQIIKASSNKNSVNESTTDKANNIKSIHNIVRQRNEIKLHVDRRRPYKLFLSYRHELIKNTKNKMFIKSILKKHGFDVIISQTSVNGVTSHIMKRMAECDACLQIYTLSETEKEKIKLGLTKEFIPDNAWLFFEYGLAMQKDMPIGRMIDVTHLLEEKWIKHVRINREGLLIPFEGDIFPNSDKENSFVKQLEKLAEELIKELNLRYNK